MQRREFLISAASVAAAATSRSLWAQAPQRAKQSTLDRIAIMTLNFQSILKVPDVEDNPNRTLELFDIAQMIADKYGVHRVEFQHYHIPSTEPSYLKELRSHIEKSKSRMTQINLEFSGLNMSAPRVRDRLMAIDLTKAWVDHAVLLGAQRVMINQGAQGGTANVMPNNENKVYGIPALKAMADYGKSKNIIVSIETRGNPLANRGRGAGAAAANPGAPPPPPLPENLPQPGLQTWQIMSELIKGAGAYSNPDVGNCNANSQQELHQCLSKELLFPTAGAMHCRVNTAWDLTTAIKYVTGLGYNGIFTAESNLGHEGNRPIYEAVLAAI